MRFRAPHLYCSLFCLLVLSFSNLTLFADETRVVFLGTDPVALNAVPSAASVISSFGIDAVGNQFYADTSLGQIIERNTSGTTATIAKGLTQPIIAVDFRGIVFVADTGKNRILRIDKGYKFPVTVTTVLATGVHSLHAIAVDSADNVFVVSGNAVLEIPHGGTLTSVASVSGATALAVGPALDGTRRLYILSQQGGSMSAYLYSYKQGSGELNGPIPGFLPAVAGDTISNFVVDAHDHAVVLNPRDSGAQIVLGTSTGFQNTLYTSHLPASAIAEDPNGAIDFLDTAGLVEIQLGAVNFGTCRVPDHGAPCDDSQASRILNLHFGAPAGVSYRPSNPTGSFQFPTNACSDPLSCADHFESAPVMPVQFNLVVDGLLTGRFTVTDENNNKLSIPLYGYGIVPEIAYYDPAPNLSKKSGSGHPIDVAIASNCPTNWECGGIFVMEEATGEIAPYNAYGPPAKPVVTGLANPLKFAIDDERNFYITQAGVAGILVVAADGSRKHIATDLAAPIGVTLDGAHNLYATNGDDIVKITADGTDVLLLTPEMDGGFRSAISIATDYQGNLYAGFASSPNSDRGTILKITPAGSFEVLHANVVKPAALAASRTSVLYFTDAGKGTLNVFSSNGILKVLAYGLKNPTGVVAEEGGLITGADSDLGIVFQAGGMITGRNFGNVPLDSSRTATLTVVEIGTDPDNRFAGVTIQPENCQSDFTPAGRTFVATSLGELLNVPFTIQPIAVGPAYCLMDLYDGNNYLDTYPKALELRGNGVASPGSATYSLAAPAKPVVSQPLTIRISALKPDLSLNTSFNGQVQISFTGAATGAASVTLIQGTGQFTMTPPATGTIYFVVTGHGITSRTNVNVGKSPSRVVITGAAFHTTASGPTFSATVSVSSVYGLPGDDFTSVQIYVDGTYRTWTNGFKKGTAAFTTGAIAGVAAGNHALMIQYNGSPVLLPSQATVMVPYTP